MEAGKNKIASEQRLANKLTIEAKEEPQSRKSHIIL